MLEDLLRGIRGGYYRMPRWAKALVGRGYGALPLTWRMGAEFGDFSSLARSGSNWSSQQIRSYQTQEVRRTLEAAYRDVPFYRRHFKGAGVKPSDFSSLEDIVRFPFLTKADVKQNLDELIAVNVPAWRRLPVTTGGSTAEPMRFFQLKGVTRSKEKAFIWDQWSRFGYAPRARTIQFKGRDVGSPKQKTFWEYEPIENFLEMNSNYLTDEFLPLYLQQIERFKPLFMIGYVSSIYLLAKFLSRNPQYPVPQLQAIFLASENVYRWQRSELEKVFNCPISSHYGHSEMVLLGSECPLDSQLHFYPQYGFLELIDGAGRRVDVEGDVGELVGTGFHNPVMPFIRYRTQDYGELGIAKCSCHSHWPTLKDVEGRLQEFIVTRDHRLISICVMGAAHFDTLDNVDQTQYYQDTPGYLVFKVVPREGCSEADLVRIQKAIKDKVGDDVDVSIEVVSSIPRTVSGKHMMIEQKIPLDILAGTQDHVLRSTN